MFIILSVVLRLVARTFCRRFTLRDIITVALIF